VKLVLFPSIGEQSNFISCTVPPIVGDLRARLCTPLLILFIVPWRAVDWLLQPTYHSGPWGKSAERGVWLFKTTAITTKF